MKHTRALNVLSKGLGLWIMLVVVLAQAAGAYAFTPEEEQDIALLDRTAKAFAAVVKSATPAVVGVQVEKSIDMTGAQNPMDFFNDPFFRHFFGPQFQPPQNPHQQPRKEMGLGSGFIVSKDGYILTNNHVVGGADKIKVKLADGRELTAKVIGTDPQSDVAVIKIDADNLPVLPLGDSDRLEVGEWVIAIGNPFGLSQTVTVGVASAKGRSRVGISDYEDFIQTDAAINPGNSGGPLINIHGQAVGMNTAIFSRSGGYMGIGFAIPINMAKDIMQQLITKGKVTRGWLGVIIQDMNEDLAKSFGLKDVTGVLVAKVLPGSPADKGGLKEGDIILQADGQPVENASDLRNKVALMAPGTVLKLNILRKERPEGLTITIGEQTPEKMAAATHGPEQGLLKKVGLSVETITPELAQQFGYKEGQGVIISKVEPGSPAAEVGMRPGYLIDEVNHKPVHNMKDFMQALSLSKLSQGILFRFGDGEVSRYAVIRLQ